MLMIIIRLKLNIEELKNIVDDDANKQMNNLHVIHKINEHYAISWRYIEFC